MTWAGFVKSRRGSNGGYWLLKPAAHIRVTDVVAFLSHPIQAEENEDPVVQALA
jgi:DNA-binding IscR family transcriptional regulator